MKWHTPQTVIALMALAFLLGSVIPLGNWWRDQLTPPRLAAQGRGPINPPPPTVLLPGADTDVGPQVVYSEESGQSSAGNGFLAVTGSYGVGTSVLYLVDTYNRQLVVYEARGGSAEQRRIVLVGARKIDLDLQLEKYNDRSEYPYRRLKSMFDKRKEPAPEASTEPGRDRR